MKNLLLDYNVAKMCLEAVEGQWQNLHELGGSKSEVVMGESCDVFVGETASHNVAIFTSPDVERRLTFGELIAALKNTRVSIKNNPYQIPPDLFKMWSKVSPAAFEAVNTLHYQQAQDDGISKPWIFAGYAQGGALAQLAAAAFKPALLVTYGAPDAGGDVLQDVIDDACDWNRWEMIGDWNPASLPRMYNVKSHPKFISVMGAVEYLPTVAFRKPQDWFTRTPMYNYVDWLEDAV